MDSTEFDNLIKYEDNNDREDAYELDDVYFYQKLLKQKMVSTSDGEGVFAYYHLRGAHPPFIYNDKVETDLSGNVTQIQQIKGSFNIVYEYIDQMKAIGVYDNTTIVLMADHGVQFDYPNELKDQPCVPAFFIKPSQSQGQQMQNNSAPVTTENFRATLVEVAGGDPSHFGVPLFDVDEDAQVLRKYYWNFAGKSLHEFDIDGDANDIDSYKFVKELPFIYLDQ